MDTATRPVTAAGYRRAIRFTAPDRVEYLNEPWHHAPLAPKQMLVETEASVISAGTELAVLSGSESWAPLPTEPGYGAVGHVVKAGAEARFAIGQRVFCYGAHASMNVVEDAFAVPDLIAAHHAPVIARMGQVAMTAVRIARPELGDVVVVIGLGLVGSLCAQFMRLSGCTVIGLDVSARRREAALATGVDHVIDPRAGDPIAAVRAIAGPGMCRTVVEATGVPAQVATAARLAGQDGNVVLLGTPRGRFDGDTTDLLRAVHLADTHVNLTGAHEWYYPRHSTPGCRHSIERNIAVLFDLAGRGLLRVEPLISHHLAPTRCAEAYAGLRARDDAWLGVVFDWSSGDERSSTPGKGIP